MGAVVGCNKKSLYLKLFFDTMKPMLDQRPIEIAETSTDVILAARDKVLASPGQEIVLAIAGGVSQQLASINEFIPIDGLETSRDAAAKDVDGSALNNVNRSFRNRNDERIGEAHSHLERHPFDLSSADRQEIQRRRGVDPKQIFVLFKNEGSGRVSFKSYNAEGRAIPTRITSHATGEVKTSDPLTPKSTFGSEFWGTKKAA